MAYAFIIALGMLSLWHAIAITFDTALRVINNVASKDNATLDPFKLS